MHNTRILSESVSPNGHHEKILTSSSGSRPRSSRQRPWDLRGHPIHPPRHRRYHRFVHYGRCQPFTSFFERICHREFATCNLITDVSLKWLTGCSDRFDHLGLSWSHKLPCSTRRYPLGHQLRLVRTSVIGVKFKYANTYMIVVSPFGVLPLRASLPTPLVTLEVVLQRSPFGAWKPLEGLMQLLPPWPIFPPCWLLPPCTNSSLRTLLEVWLLIFSCSWHHS